MDLATAVWAMVVLEAVFTIHSGVAVCIVLIIAHSIALGVILIHTIMDSTAHTIIMATAVDMVTTDTLATCTMLHQVLVA